MPRIICRTYSAGTFAGVTFAEQVIDGQHVGVGKTTDEQALAWFRSRPGFDVDEPPSPPAEPKALDEHTVDQLKAIAAEHEIDLEGASKKADILVRVQAAMSAQAPVGDAPPAE